MDPATASSSAASADSTSANTSTSNNNSNGTGRKGQNPKRGGGRNNNQPKGAQSDSTAGPKPKRQDGRNKKDRDSTTAGSASNPRAPRTIAATDPIDLQTGRVSADAENSATTTTTSTAPSVAEDGAEHSCFICTENIVIFAVSDCNHRTCHLCSLRLRALYKTKNCAYCKVTFETTSCLQKRS